MRVVKQWDRFPREAVDAPSLEVWPRKFSHYSGKQLLCSPPVSPVLASNIHRLAFSAQVLEEDTCSAKPALCPTGLTSNTLELPAPVLLRDDSGKVTSIHRPQDVQKQIPRGSY